MKAPIQFKSNKESALVFLAAFPLISGVILVSGIPTILAIGSSFTDIVLGRNINWNFIGIENYRRAFQNDLFIESFKIGAIWSLSVAVIALGVGFITALLVGQDEWYAPILKLTAMLPWAMSPVAVAILWQIMLEPSSGPVNGFLRVFNLPGKNLSLLGDFNTALPVVIVIGAWVSLPVVVISLVASLKTIRTELVEAAQIDGASSWQVLRNVKIPHLRPIITSMFVLNIIWNFNSFGLVYVLTSGGPGGKTYLPALFVYHESFKYGNFGYAAALGTIMTMVLVLVLGIYVYQRTKRDVEA
jgi:multiple sugar transport system permease protein